MTASAPIFEVAPPMQLTRSSPRTSLGSLSQLSGQGPEPSKRTASKSATSVQSSPALQTRQVSPLPGDSGAGLALPTPSTLQAAFAAYSEASAPAAAPFSDVQRRIEESVDNKITKVLQEIRSFVSQRIDAFMDQLRTEKVSRERSALDLQRQLDDLCQKTGSNSLVPFEDLARMTTAAASKLEGAVDHAHRCCESAREAIQRDVTAFRHDVEEHRTKHFAEIAALLANKVQTSSPEEPAMQKKTSGDEVGLAEVREEFDGRCNTLSHALELCIQQVQQLHGRDLSVALASGRTDGGNLEEVTAALDKRDRAMRQDIESLRLQLGASSATLKEQLGQHLDKTVDAAQATLMRSFLEEHKTLLGSLMEERESRAQEVSRLNARLDRALDNGKSIGADSGSGKAVNGEVAPDGQISQDIEGVRSQVESLRVDISALRESSLTSKFVDELRESKRLWSIDAVRLQERLADSMQRIGTVQSQFREMQEWRESVASQLSSGGLQPQAGESSSLLISTSSGAVDMESLAERLVSEMTALRSEVRTSLDSAMTAVRLGEHLANELQTETQARQCDTKMLHSLLGKAGTRGSLSAQSAMASENEVTSVSNSASVFQARIQARGPPPANSYEFAQPSQSQPQTPLRAPQDVSLEELNLELQRRLQDKVAPPSASASGRPFGSGQMSGQMWASRDAPRVPLLDLSSTEFAREGTADSEVVFAPGQQTPGKGSAANIQPPTAMQGGSILWSSGSCQSVGPLLNMQGTGASLATSPQVERLTSMPMASPGGVSQSGVRSLSSQRPRPVASPSAGGLRNIQPQPAGPPSVGVALSAGGPIRQQTLPPQRLTSTSSLQGGSGGSMTVNVATAAGGASGPTSVVHPAGVLQAGQQLKAPSPRISSLVLEASPATGSPMRSRNTRASMPGATMASPNQRTAVSPMRQVSGMPAGYGSSVSAAAGASVNAPPAPGGSVRNLSPRSSGTMLSAARSMSPLRVNGIVGLAPH